MQNLPFGGQRPNNRYLTHKAAALSDNCEASCLHRQCDYCSLPLSQSDAAQTVGVGGVQGWRGRRKKKKKRGNKTETIWKPC